MKYKLDHLDEVLDERMHRAMIINTNMGINSVSTIFV